MLRVGAKVEGLSAGRGGSTRMRCISCEVASSSTVFPELSRTSGDASCAIRTSVIFVNPSSTA